MGDMLGWHALCRRGTLTPIGLGVVALSVVPFLLDVVLCDEFNTATLHQPALVDGEEVDPSKATADSISPDHYFPSRIVLSAATDDRKSVPTYDPLSPPYCYAVVSLTSRPPPIS